MPSRFRHLDAATSNAKFAEELLREGIRLDWTAVAAFYAALHFVDAFLKAQNVHPATHADRDVYLRRTQLREVYDHYRKLRFFADQARYNLRGASLSTVRELLDVDLAAVRARVERLGRQP